MDDADKIIAAILATAYRAKTTGGSVEFLVGAHEEVLAEMAKREKKQGIGARLEAAIERHEKRS